MSWTRREIGRILPHALLALQVALAACGQEAENSASPQNPELSDNGNAVAKTKSKSSKKTAAKSSEGADESNPSGEEEPDGSHAQEGEDGPGEGESGYAFFRDHLTGLFDQWCGGCHADPRENPPQKGPLTIFSYESMQRLLSAGRGPLDNALFAKVVGATPHAGGNLCPGGKNASPCSDIQTWWKREFGTPQDGAMQGPLGTVATVSALGKVYGWAVDPQNPAASVSVRFYLDGPAGSGLAIGETLANVDGDDANQPGAHAFIFDLPAAAKDRSARRVFAYALIDSREKLLQEGGMSFTAYAPSETGRAFFNANVAGQLTGCQGCHAVSYEQKFYALLSPAPSQGGTALANQLINKAGQLNGTTHGGGQRCAGGANSGPCATFQRWWQLEFGEALP